MEDDIEIAEIQPANRRALGAAHDDGRSSLIWTTCEPDALALFPEFFERETESPPGSPARTTNACDPGDATGRAGERRSSCGTPPPGDFLAPSKLEEGVVDEDLKPNLDSKAEDHDEKATLTDLILEPTSSRLDTQIHVTDATISLTGISTNEIDITRDKLPPRGQKRTVKQEVIDIDVAFSEPMRPVKKPRIIMEAVEILKPSWLSSKVEVKKEEGDFSPTKEKLCVKKEEEDREKDFLNPKWKIKRSKEDEEAGFNSVFSRVEALGVKPFPVGLDDGALDFLVSRRFISSTYGGSPQGTFPTIDPEKLARHGFGDFMFLNLYYNPRAPQRAGYPGLFYRSRSSDIPQYQRVFIRIDDNQWLYLGQYELLPAEPLSAKEWKENSNKTKNTWATKITSQGWSREVRVRMSLRKTHHREPTADEIARYSGDAKVTPEEVMRAYNKGEERLGAWVMKCIGYDETFQRDLMEKHAAWERKGNSAREQKKSSTGKRRGK